MMAELKFTSSYDELKTGRKRYRDLVACVELKIAIYSGMDRHSLASLIPAHVWRNMARRSFDWSSPEEKVWLSPPCPAIFKVTGSGGALKRMPNCFDNSRVKLVKSAFDVRIAPMFCQLSRCCGARVKRYR